MTLPTHAVPTLLILLIIANIALIAILKPLGDRLKASGERCGIVHFELAWRVTHAGRIMIIWRKAGLEQTARLSLWLDFAFLLAYPLGLALTCWVLADSGSGWLAQAGVGIGYAVLACTPLDALENIALLHMLDKGADETRTRVAALCAVIKFSLAGLAVLYVAIALPTLLF